MFENNFLTLKNKPKIKAQQQGETSCNIQFHAYLKQKNDTTYDQEGL